jgi:hypothetical protein
MSTVTTELTVWNPTQPLQIPTSASPSQIAQCARQLTERDVRSVVQAFETGSYEMVSTFVWTKAVVALKKQIATLGMEFVGEMLGRPDLHADSDPLTSIGEHEAVSLAEDLGMVTPTDAMRMKHALELVSHFADTDKAAIQEMMPEEAVMVLRTCVASVLGNPKIAPPVEFASLRRALENKTFDPDDVEVKNMIASPYFFLRTTLSVLLSLLKTGKGAQLEHAIGNANVFIPRMWPALRQPERWQTGQAYAELAAEGRRSASTGLKKVLLTVKGFDFVPETLRSDTYSAAAHQVLTAHFGYNNFYNEPEPMRVLADLGTTIPLPAFPVCMTATLCVRLGNRWGYSGAAQAAASQVLDGLRKEQWEYYLNHCLRSDKNILDKLASDDRPLKRWVELVGEFDLNAKEVPDKHVARLLTDDDQKLTVVAHAAGQLRLRAASQS